MSDEQPCFISVSVEAEYLRIEYESPLGNTEKVRHCIIEWAVLCKTHQRSVLLLVRNPNGLHDYTIFDLRELSDIYRFHFNGIAIALVDPAVNLNLVFLTAVNKANEVVMECFRDEASAIAWIESAQDG